jgi:hypothetical protein
MNVAGGVYQQSGGYYPDPYQMNTGGYYGSQWSPQPAAPAHQAQSVYGYPAAQQSGYGSYAGYQQPVAQQQGYSYPQQQQGAYYLYYSPLSRPRSSTNHQRLLFVHSYSLATATTCTPMPTPAPTDV